MVVLSTRVSYTTQLSGSTFHSGKLYNTTEWWYFHSRELYNTTELTHELSDVCNLANLCYLGFFSPLLLKTRLKHGAFSLGRKFARMNVQRCSETFLRGTLVHQSLLNSYNVIHPITCLKGRYMFSMTYNSRKPRNRGDMYGVFRMCF